MRFDWAAFLKRPVYNPPSGGEGSAFAGKTVLVTGAAGSVGSAIFRRLQREKPARLILLDRSIPGLRALSAQYDQSVSRGPAVEFAQADILDSVALQSIFALHQPEIVFHAAAEKHLVCLESSPFVGFENNVTGTMRMCLMAERFGVRCFVNVSTDKAVNPASVLGASKRIAEILVGARRRRKGCWHSLRLGNVLESSGSVVPILVEAAQQRRPLPITDITASRFFVTMDEAAAFLTEAAQFQESSLLIPRMGAPRSIADLAGFVLAQLGEGRALPAISLIGLRDGEKKSEQLTFDHEHLEPTHSRRIFRVAGNPAWEDEEFDGKLQRFLTLVERRQASGFIDRLTDLVPEFEPSPTLLRAVG